MDLSVLVSASCVNNDQSSEIRCLDLDGIEVVGMLDGRVRLKKSLDSIEEEVLN